MGNIYSVSVNNNKEIEFGKIVKDSITKHKHELLTIVSLLTVNSETIKLSIERHVDQETIKILTSHKDMSELKLRSVNRVLVQLDDVLFQLTVGIDDDELVQLLINTNVVICDCADIVYVLKLNEMTVIIDNIINTLLSVDSKKMYMKTVPILK